MKAGRGLHIGKGFSCWAPRSIFIGDNVYIGKDVTIECNALIGNSVLIANRVSLIGRNDHAFRAVGIPVRFSPWVGSSSAPEWIRTERIVVEDDVWIGFGAIILTKVKVGKGSVIAAGAVVTKDVSPYSIVSGNPAREIGRRFTTLEIEKHEMLTSKGKFVFSERGYDHWTVEPGIVNE